MMILVKIKHLHQQKEHMWKTSQLKELHFLRLVGDSCMMDFVATECETVVTELEEQLWELLFSLTQLSDLNSVVLVVTKYALVKYE